MTRLPEQIPPGPTPRELLPRIRKIQTDALGFLMELSTTYGDLVYFPVASQPVYVVNHPDGVRHILQEQNRRYTKNTIQYNSLSTITGKGLLTSDGAFWLRQRRLAQPAFARPRMMALDQIIVPAVQAMLERWKEPASKGQPVDVDDEMMRLTLEIVGKALFSIDLSSDASRLTGAVLTALDHIIFRARNIIVPPDYIPTPRNLRFRRALRTLDEAVYAIIADRRQGGGGKHSEMDDLLNVLINARDEETGELMSDRQVRDEVMTMLIAGHETVASALTWTWFLLSSHTDEQECLRSEVVRVLNGRLPAATDLPDLPYTAQVFSEALRLYPPAWVISRRAVEEDEVLGYPIPTGALIIISPYVVHRRPDFWEDAANFIPARFSSETEGKRHRFAYIPFGGGPRLCIGSNFAAVEAHLIMAMITQHYRLELAPQANIKMDALVTLRPHYGLPMRLIPYT
jgi:cytochrome P450